MANEKRRASREIRLNALSAKKANHDLKIRHRVLERTRKDGSVYKSSKRMTFSRKERKRPGKQLTIIAYDFETTRIAAGTPKPLYITAFSDNLNYVLSRELNGVESVKELLDDELLTDRFSGSVFVAWNANNFDVYFIALALLTDKRYVLRPYLTKSKALRGLRVILREDLVLKPNVQRHWEFLDGVSMLGLQGKSLADFLKTFAPDYQKLERKDSWEKREFDPNDSDDVDYAMRDSEGLYWGMIRAQEIIFERFNMGLRTTMGNLGIRIFESHIPEDVLIREPTVEVLSILRESVMRGGYCHLMRKYKGPVWKYDLNQAYAAAMREAQLPAGDCGFVKGETKYAKVFICRITAENPRNKIPFYVREIDGDSIKSAFPITRINNAWITSSELNQLKAENWKIKVHESYCWYNTFDMGEYVTALETLRRNAPGGPSGAVGTMIKQIGNNSYGKTAERLEPLELVLSAECPSGFVDYYGRENPNTVPYVWCRLVETPTKKYHQPQLASFITAHVRMVVRRAALLAPDEFLYADTDCVIFSKDVTKQLDVDSSRYGAFKLEENGAEFILIAKKVYASGDFKTKHSKGLVVKELEFADFVKWFDGVIPIQKQVQRQNFVKVMRGSAMFLDRTRKGTQILVDCC